MINRKLYKNVDELKQLVMDGWTNEDIGKLFGVTTAGVRYWIKKLNLVQNPVIVPFTDQQKEKIVELSKGKVSAKAIATQLSTTQARILKVLKDNNCDTSASFFKEHNMPEFVEAYNSGMTQEELAQHFGCYRQSVEHAFDKYSIERRTKNETKQLISFVDQTAFTNMEDEQSLFYYGLLLADGCISDKGCVSIGLQLSDEHILKSFKSYLKSSNDVRHYHRKNANSYYQFTFQDKVVAETLRKLGMEPRKSTTEKMPILVNKLPINTRHFWRGYVCGDGCVRSYNKVPKLHICGSEEICQEFILFCNEVLGYDSKMSVAVTNDKRRTVKLYYTQCNGVKAKIISLFMFENSIVSINRKLKDVLEFKQWNPKPVFKAYGISLNKYNRFRVTFFLNGKQTSHGSFTTEDEAVEKRLELEMKYLGYHKSLQHLNAETLT